VDRTWGQANTAENWAAASLRIRCGMTQAAAQECAAPDQIQYTLGHMSVAMRFTYFR